MATKKQSEYKTVIKLAGMLDPSYARAFRNAKRYADEFMAMDRKGKAKEIGIIAAGKAMQWTGKAIQAGAKLAAAGMRGLLNVTKESVEKAVEFESAMMGVKKVTEELQVRPDRALCVAA